MRGALLLAAALTSWAGQGSNGSAPPPFYPRSTTSNQSLGAINRNFADVTGRNRDRLVGAVGDQDCSANNGLLVGATEKGGFLLGGSCTPAKAVGTAVAFTGNVTMSTTTTVTASGTTAQASMLVAFATATLTVVGSTVTVAINCPIDYSTTGGYNWAGVMMDGLWLGAETSLKGLATSGAIGAGNAINLTTPPIPFVVTSGTHSFALSLASSGGGTITFPSSHAEACRLIVSEFH